MLTQASLVAPEQTSGDQQEQSDQEEQDEKQQVSSNHAVPSSSLQFNLDYQSYLLAEVIYQEDSEETNEASDELFPTIQKALHVILRRIISPNAP